MNPFSNNLVIGLGGAGGRAIAAFRRLTIERGESFKEMTGRGTRFEYLYIDSCQDIPANRDLWETCGRDVRLPLNNTLTLQPPDSPFVAFSANIRPWLPDPDILKDYLPDKRSYGSGACQNRLCGRFLFACNAPQIRAAVAAGFHRLLDHAEDRSVDIHVFASAGGGTGSGGLIDIITLVNHLCRNEIHRRYRVHVYLFVGGEGAARYDVGFFYRNEYCTLRDLNALCAGLYKPHMALLDGSPFDNGGEEPTRNIYICSDISRTPFSGLQDQARFMAGACFDIISICSRKWMDEEIVRTFASTRPQEGGGHCYNFAVLTTGVWQTPGTELRKALHASVRRQVLQRWVSGDDHRTPPPFPFGTLKGEEPPILNLAAAVAASRTTEKLNARLKEKVREVVELSGMLSGSAFDRKALDFWNTRISRILEKIGKDAQALELHGLYNSDIHDDVYDIEVQLHRALADKREWRGQPFVWGLRDCAEYLRALKLHLTGLIDGIHKRQAPKRDMSGLEKRSAEWKKLTFLSAILKRKKLLKKHLVESVGLIERAYDDFRDQVLAEFYRSLLNRVERMTDTVYRVLDSLLREAEQAQHEFETAWRSLMEPPRYGVRHEFNRRAVEDFFEYIPSDGAKHGLRELMQHLEKVCWQDAWSSELTVEYPTQTDIRIPSLLERLRNSDYESLKFAKGLADQTPGLSNIFERPLLCGLQARWMGVDDACRRQEILHFVHDLASGAALSPDSNYREHHLASPRTALVLSMPQGDDGDTGELIENTIRQELRVFHYASPGSDPEDAIRVLKLEYWMPARFLSVLTRCIAPRLQRALKHPDAMLTARFCNIDPEGAVCDEYAPGTTRPALLPK